MKDYRNEPFKEYTEFYNKKTKLAAFILSEEFDTLPEIDRKDIRAQYELLNEYFEILSRRCSRQCNNT